MADPNTPPLRRLWLAPLSPVSPTSPPKTQLGSGQTPPPAQTSSSIEPLKHQSASSEITGEFSLQNKRVPSLQHPCPPQQDSYQQQQQQQQQPSPDLPVLRSTSSVHSDFNSTTANLTNITNTATTKPPLSPLTPPQTPHHLKAMPNMPNRSVPSSRLTSLELERTAHLPSDPLLYKGSFSPLKEVGSGQFSVVYCVEELQPALRRLSNPIKENKDSQGKLLAVKTPRKAYNNAAKKVLRQEGLVLSFLYSERRKRNSDRPCCTSNAAEEYLVNFYGLHLPTGGLVLEYLPQTLEQKVQETQAPTSKTEPWISTHAFLRVARGVVAGLAWLHARGVVHGDIKPANCLVSYDSIIDGGNVSSPGGITSGVAALHISAASLNETCIECSADRSSATAFAPALADQRIHSPSSEHPWLLKLADFSSSRLLTDPSKSPLDAFTLSYAAPEFLSSYLKPGGGLPTLPADVWSLAATLAFAATGETPYALLTNNYAKMAEAKKGTILEWAARGVQAARIQRGGVAEGVVGGVLGERKGIRMRAEEWREVLEDL